MCCFSFDFWKGFTIAEVFIFVCYLIMGMVVYSAQGQFSFNPAYQGRSGVAEHVILCRTDSFCRHSKLRVRLSDGRQCHLPGFWPHRSSPLWYG